MRTSGTKVQGLCIVIYPDQEHLPRTVPETMAKPSRRIAIAACDAPVRDAHALSGRRKPGSNVEAICAKKTTV